MKKIIRFITIIFTVAFLLQFALCSSAPVADKQAPRKYELQKIDTGKKVLVAYYSKTGNTERVAKDMAYTFGADIEKILDKKERGGCINWFRSGRDGMKELPTDIEPVKHDPSKYDIVILGSPVWGWNMTPAIRTYIEQNKSKFRDVAFFITSGNTSIDKVLPYLEKLSEKKSAASVGFVEKELGDEKVYLLKLNEFLGRFSRTKK
jgi:flavodoxin